MRKMTKRSAIIAAVAAVAVGTAGAAYAWTVLSDTGHSAAASSNIVPMTVNGANVVGKLYPTAVRDVSFTVTNGNDFPVKLNSATITGFGGGGTGCTPASSVLTAATPLDLTGNNITVAPGGTSPTLTFTGGVTMSSNAPLACANKDFTVDITVSGAVGDATP